MLYLHSSLPDCGHTLVMTRPVPVVRESQRGLPPNTNKQVAIRTGGEVVHIQEMATPGTEVATSGGIEKQLTQIMVQMEKL